MFKLTATRDEESGKYAPLHFNVQLIRQGGEASGQVGEQDEAE
jgi:hypothetical protein